MVMGCIEVNGSKDGFRKKFDLVGNLWFRKKFDLVGTPCLF